MKPELTKIQWKRNYNSSCMWKIFANLTCITDHLSTMNNSCIYEIFANLTFINRSPVYFEQQMWCHEVISLYIETITCFTRYTCIPILLKGLNRTSFEIKRKNNMKSYIKQESQKHVTFQASTLTFVRLSGTSENWLRTSRSCITVVRRDKWKNQRFPNVPVRRTNLFPLV